VVRETADAASFVLDVPPDLADTFAYRAGQFVTFRVQVDGERHYRSYSMCSAPALGEDLQVTVKRTAGGVVSNWLNDTIAVGDILETSPPAGSFVLHESSRDVVAFAGGSGITPIYAIIKTALATTNRGVRLFYANRDRESAIFHDEITALACRHPDRLSVIWHLDDERGVGNAEFYLCGPTPFMEVVRGMLVLSGVPAARTYIEQFTPAADPTAEAAAQDIGASGAVELTVEVGPRSMVLHPRSGAMILHAARAAGLNVPSSCELGNCATCIARVVEGTVTMHRNEVLTPDEVRAGWVLTCQGSPTSPRVHVIYE
jgi:ferredoxin-NADP reductase